MRVLMMILFLAFVTGCGRSGSVEAEPAGDGEGPVKVVVTVPPLAWPVEYMFEERARVTVLLPEGASPHGWEPTPSDVLALSLADWVLVSTPSEQDQIAKLISLPTDRILSMTHENDGIETTPLGELEHPWLTQVLMHRFCIVVGGHMQAENPKRKVDQDIFNVQLEGLVTDRARGILVVTGHDAWSGMFRRFDVDKTLALRHDHHDEPNATDLADLRAKAIAADRVLVVLDPHEDEPWLRDLAEEVGAATVVLDPVGSRDWLGDMIARYEAVAAALESLE